MVGVGRGGSALLSLLGFLKFTYSKGKQMRGQKEHSYGIPDLGGGDGDDAIKNIEKALT